MLVPATKPTRDCRGVTLSSKTQSQENQRRDFVPKTLENTPLVWRAAKPHIRFGWTLKAFLHSEERVVQEREQFRVSSRKTNDYGDQ